MQGQRICRIGLRLALVALLTSTILPLGGCASLPLKQRSLVVLQSVETALDNAQDFERANHTVLGEDVVANDQLRKLCPSSALPAPLPVGATVHQVVACLFVQAFSSQAASATALQSIAGTSAPATVSDLRGEVDAIFAVIKGLSANANQQKMLALAQQAVDQAFAIAKLFTPVAPSTTPGGGA